LGEAIMINTIIEEGKLDGLDGCAIIALRGTGMEGKKEGLKNKRFGSVIAAKAMALLYSNEENRSNLNGLTGELSLINILKSIYGEPAARVIANTPWLLEEEILNEMKKNENFKSAIMASYDLGSNTSIIEEKDNKGDWLGQMREISRLGGKVGVWNHEIFKTIYNGWMMKNGRKNVVTEEEKSVWGAMVELQEVLAKTWDDNEKKEKGKKIFEIEEEEPKRGNDMVWKKEVIKQYMGLSEKGNLRKSYIDALRKMPNGKLGEFLLIKDNNKVIDILSQVNSNNEWVMVMESCEKIKKEEISSVNDIVWAVYGREIIGPDKDIHRWRSVKEDEKNEVVSKLLVRCNEKGYEEYKEWMVNINRINVDVYRNENMEQEEVRKWKKYRETIKSELMMELIKNENYGNEAIYVNKLWQKMKQKN
ncbi:MAG: hypothetical protein ACO3K7_02320, partial [Candidatus Marinamargulisbacteria bacterium]